MRTVTVLFIKTFGLIVIAEEIRFFMVFVDVIAFWFQFCTLDTPVVCIAATTLSALTFLYIYLTFLVDVCLLSLLFYLCLTPKTQLYAAWHAMACLLLAWRYVSQI
jgi:hypothetical protein